MSTAVASELTAAVTQFLEAAVHTLLKARGVYSPSLFESRRLYGIPVSQCRHPGVCSYVGTVLGGLKDTLQEVVVAFYEPGGALHSKCAFIVQGFSASTQPPDWSALEPALRSALLKLHFSDNVLAPLPEGSTFELLVVTTSRAGVNQQLFVEEPAGSAGGLQLAQPATGWPIGTCLLPGVLSMQVVLEEGASQPRQHTAAGGTQATTSAPPAAPASDSAAANSGVQALSTQ